MCLRYQYNQALYLRAVINANEFENLTDIRISAKIRYIITFKTKTSTEFKIFRLNLYKENVEKITK